ncbi:class I SAM-dependent methyltransferase [Mesorhizobium sp.]|uniref:O-methyltransferase n=1 Tax=Mesorhizobium sp. TaxID=1871066 RepID=UPI00257D0D2F|nr:class I SAM-dependent methyltransferase [Mesorhizobium sp.]
MDTALEFGSGRSTIWFASRVGRLTSVEDNQSWHRVVSEKLAMKRVSNVNFLYHPQDVQTGAEAGSASYVRVVSEFADESLDFVLVDGIYRNHCALGAVPKVRPGGLIVIDNVNWFLPSTSRSPRARTLAQGPADEVWAQFADATNGWRRIWTTSGVTDTLLLFKP